MRHAFRLPAYRRLLTAYALNELATLAGALALTVLVYRRTGSALAASAYFLAAQFVPALVAPALVSWVGHRPARTVLAPLYAGEAAMFGMLALLIDDFSLAPVLALTFIDGVLALTARSVARTASVDVLTAAGMLRDGNALLNAAFSLCFFAGPALGGLGAASGGIRAMLVIVAAGFAAIAALIWTRRDLPPASPERRDVGLRDAVARARTAPLVWRMVLLLGVTVAVNTIATPVEIVYVRRSLHLGDSGYGALLSAWGGGAVLGSAVYARWRTLSGRVLIAASSVALGAGFAVIAVADGLAPALAGAALAGVGNGVLVVAFRTELQERIPPELMAVVIAITEAVAQGALGAGIVVGGALAAIAGPRAALAVAACGAIAVALAMWGFLRPADPPAARAARSAA